MNRTLMRELYEHLLAEPVKNNEVAGLIKRMEEELQYFPIASISRSDIQRVGYDGNNLSDEDVMGIAATMNYCYRQEAFDEDLYYAAQSENCSRTFLPECPYCSFKNTDYDLNTKTSYCKDCGCQWGLDECSEVSSDEFIRIEHDESTTHFTDRLDCYSSRGGAFYMTRNVYRNILQREVPEASSFRLVYWPWSQAFGDLCGKGDPCERIEDKIAHTFGLKDGCMVPTALFEQEIERRTHQGGF